MESFLLAFCTRFFVVDWATISLADSPLCFLFDCLSVRSGGKIDSKGLDLFVAVPRLAPARWLLAPLFTTSFLTDLACSSTGQTALLLEF